MTKLLSEKPARARAIHNIKLYWEDIFKEDILDMRKFYWSLQDINELGEFERAAIFVPASANTMSPPSASK